MKINNNLKGIEPFLAMEVFAHAEKLEKAGKKIIHLEFGEPDFNTPEPIIKAAIQSIREGKTRYTHTQGIEQFRSAVVKKYNRLYGKSISQEQILTSSGTSILIYLSILMLAPAGSEIIITDPGYACYENLLVIAGVKPVKIPLNLNEGFQLNVDIVKKRITKKTKAIILNSPNNPTGVVLKPEIYKELAELGIPIISDEIYGDLIYKNEFNSILNFTDDAIVLNGFSKFYAMTGWRLGYAILPLNMVSTAKKLHQNMMISAADFVQHAGVAAILEGENECRKMRDTYNLRREFLIKRLKAVGLDPGYEPDGAFYILF
ncbi:MAG: aminotransferase class I/II-fold pyridoxal phosphate-dependent enzyme, partial [Proteobacteria bacterium]|nr:aminotransferase class I/II-fold pyridoxal phosphate-dependent enzyme [Pseudomonadota bacterium]